MTFYLRIQAQENLDVFSLYEDKSAIRIPEGVWFQAICASLKMKHEVLILESNSMAPTTLDKSRRWITADNFCWLSPRSLSVILEAYHHKSMKYQDFKIFLTNSK